MQSLIGQFSEQFAQKPVVCTRRLLFSALDPLAREIIGIGCYRLGQQLEKTSLLCRLKALFGGRGSKL